MESGHTAFAHSELLQNTHFLLFIRPVGELAIVCTRDEYSKIDTRELHSNNDKLHQHFMVSGKVKVYGSCMPQEFLPTLSTPNELAECKL